MDSKMPPLPEPIGIFDLLSLHTNVKPFLFHTPFQMLAYGAECRRLALEENEQMREVIRGLADIWNRDGNCIKGSPNHGHSIPGIWDRDNGELASKPCAECALYDAARAIARSQSSGESKP